MIKKLLKKILESLPENNQLERIWILAKNDFQKRYYGTGLGIAWAFVNPLLRLLIYYFVFTYFFNNRTENYILYIFSGLLVWMFFAEGTKKGITLLVNKRYLLENIQMNKLDIYISALFSGLFAFLFNYIMYFAISLFFPVHYSFVALYFPVLILNTAIIVLAISILLSVINIYIRDIEHLWDMAMMIIFWTNPIFYDKDVLISKATFLLYLNPLAGIIINIRETTLYSRHPDYQLLVYDFAISLILLFVSIFILKRFAYKAAEKL